MSGNLRGLASLDYIGIIVRRQKIRIHIQEGIYLVSDRKHSLSILLQLPTLIGAALSMVIVTLVAMFFYLLSNRLLAKTLSKDNRRSADYLFRAIGILVSLFLSLTFADVVLELNQIEASVEREAVLLEDIYRDLSQYDSDRARRSKTLLVDYTQAVISHDWPALAGDSLSTEAREIFRKLEFEILHLQYDSEVEGILRSRLLTDVDQISDLRLSRVEQVARLLAAPAALDLHCLTL